MDHLSGKLDHYQQPWAIDVFNSLLKLSATGTAATTAKFGFVNLPAEVIAGLACSDGAGCVGSEVYRDQ